MGVAFPVGGWQPGNMSVGGPYPNGCLFRYTHSKNEPAITLEMAGRVGLTVAEDGAVKTGKNHVVARLIKPEGWAVFPAGHNELAAVNIMPVYEVTPSRTLIRLEN